MRSFSENLRRGLRNISLTVITIVSFMCISFGILMGDAMVRGLVVWLPRGGSFASSSDSHGPVQLYCDPGGLHHDDFIDIGGKPEYRAITIGHVAIRRPYKTWQQPDIVDGPVLVVCTG